MKKKCIFIVCLLAVYSFCFNQVFASRAFAPAKIPPVLYKNVKIVAENSTSDNMGIVQAFNINTNKLVWSKKAYTVKINPQIEKDTQEVYIKEMKIENDKLVVIDERLKKYLLDPDTGNEINNKGTLIMIILISITLIIYVVVRHHWKRKKTIN